MPLLLTDIEIQRLIEEQKPLPDDFESRIILKPKRGHSEKELDIIGVEENQFRIILRQSLINPLDFSVILAYLPKQTNQVFLLRRYNGKSHEHTNKIERHLPFYDFHIHTATERYQRAGFKEEWYAETTNRYNIFEEAVRCMFQDCGLLLPPNPQMDFLYPGRS